jgi:hypothetical protein
MLVVEVDNLNPKTLQAGLSGLLHVCGTAVDTRCAVGAAHVAEFGGYNIVVAMAGDGPPNQFSILSGAIQIRTIEKFSPISTASCGVAMAFSSLPGP